MNKRICIIRHGYYPEDPRVRKEVSVLVEKGYEVDVICLKNKEGRGEPVCSPNLKNGVNVYCIPLRHHRGSIFWYMFEYSLAFVFFFFKISFLYLKKKYSLIQVNTMPDFLVFATIIPKLGGAKILLDMHEVMPELLDSKFNISEKHLLAKLLKLLEHLSTKYADHILAVSEPCLKLLVSRGLPSSKATIVYNVPDDNLFNFQKITTKSVVAGLQTRIKRFTLISHGSVLKRYGFQTIIRAMPYLKPHIPGIRLIIMGEGEYLQELVKLVKNLGVQDSVDFIGRVPLDEVPYIIACADIGIVSFVKDEFTNLMTPNKLFEYVAMRRPVVSAKTDGIQSCFDDSCMMFFNPGDEKELANCILKLYKDPAKREQLVENSYLKYQKIRWNVTKERYFEVMQELLKSEARSPKSEY